MRVKLPDNSIIAARKVEQMADMLFVANFNDTIICIDCGSESKATELYNELFTYGRANLSMYHIVDKNI